jgi:uncharacterized YigZ family protein
MSLPDSYFSVAQPAEGIYKDKGSKFIGYVFPVKDVDNIKEQLNYLKELHPKARHICYAYRLGFTPEEARSNDDGEPAGSAGKPILNTILASEVHFTLVAVVRYFGGTLLGVPGLIQAYKEASLEAFAAATIIEIEPMEVREIRFSYPQMNEVMKVIKKYPIQIIEQEVNNECRYLLHFAKRLSADVNAAIDKALSSF